VAILAETLSFSGSFEILTGIVVSENTIGVLLPVDCGVGIEDDALVVCANVEDDTLVVVDNVVVVDFVEVEVENKLSVAVDNVVVCVDDDSLNVVNNVGVVDDDVVDEMVHSPGLVHSP